MTTETHYVANLRVERVDITTPDAGRQFHGQPTPTGDPVRKVGEVTQLVIKAPSMEALKKKVAAHVDLIEDDVPMDPVRRPGTRG